MGHLFLDTQYVPKKICAKLFSEVGCNYVKRNPYQIVKYTLPTKIEIRYFIQLTDIWNLWWCFSSLRLQGLWAERAWVVLSTCRTRHIYIHHHVWYSMHIFLFPFLSVSLSVSFCLSLSLVNLSATSYLHSSSCMKKHAYLSLPLLVCLSFCLLLSLCLSLSLSLSHSLSVSFLFSPLESEREREEINK